jgi:TRAP-type C4-dicarboxylate transport system permease small subunit
MLEHLLVGLAALIAVVVFLQVVFRYALHQPLFWSEELPRYLLIWMAFLAAARAQRDEAHLGITLGVNRLPPGLRRWASLAVRLAMLGFLGILVYSGLLVVQITAHHRSTALQLPMAAVYAALPVGALLMMGTLGRQILRDLRGRR